MAATYLDELVAAEGNVRLAWHRVIGTVAYRSAGDAAEIVAMFSLGR